MKHAEDQGVNFGRWDDPTAQLMYSDVMPLALSGVDITGRVADYGGANGLLRKWISQAITVDYDASKFPEIVDDIRTHVGTYDLIVMRYVLHYMHDDDAIDMLAHMATYHDGRLLIIQFVNNIEDMKHKEHNSVGETKFFRTENELMQLIPSAWVVASRKAVQYRVGADFYRWRLGHENPLPHNETILILELERL